MELVELVELMELMELVELVELVEQNAIRFPLHLNHAETSLIFTA